ncbi:Uncharacterised protein [Mycobacteroides abscessus subsp. abscessus]|nr:Uncharacterised protein [Mycobacteroides abscessus subsp. abscessus]
MPARCPNWLAMMLCSSTSPLRSSSSSASPVASVTPTLMTATEMRMPNIPNRCSSAARVCASTGSESSSRTNRSTDSSALASTCGSNSASLCSATNSACRKVRAVSASRPATGTTAWQMPVRSISPANLAATSRADNIASSLPTPISSARDTTPTTPTAPPRSPPTSLPIWVSSPISAALRLRNRNITASTRGTPSSGTSSAKLRSETSVDNDEVPGVSMSVISFNSGAGQLTSRSATDAGSSRSSSKESPPSRRMGMSWRTPLNRLAVTRGAAPCRNHATIRVASVASVGAMSSPTSALTKVDLPALRVPAIATRIGSSSRAAIRRNSSCGSATRRYRESF